MNSNWKINMNLILIAVAVLLAIQVAAAGTLPKDPCALLKPAEIQAALAPNATIGNGVPATNMLPLGVECSYTWGPRTSEWGESSFKVTVIDASKAWQGTSPELIQQGLLIKAKAGGPNASVITGIGDAAVFTFEARSF